MIKVGKCLRLIIIIIFRNSKTSWIKFSTTFLRSFLESYRKKKEIWGNGFVRRNIRFFLESSCIPPGVAAPWLWWWRARASWGCGWMAVRALPAGSPGLTPTPTPRWRAPCCVVCAGSSMLIIARHPSSDPRLPPPPSSASDNTPPIWTRRLLNPSPLSATFLLIMKLRRKSGDDNNNN